MKLMITLGFIILSAALNTQAANFNGLISKLNSKTTITLTQTSTPLNLEYATPEIKKQINKLKTNDFISLEGCLSADRSTITANSVNYVGLKDLLGNWIGNDTYCYQFNTYLSMTVYAKTPAGGCDFTAVKTARDFSAIINPSTPTWSVLLSDDNNTYLMDLNLHSRKSAELSLYDNQSGDIITHIKLKR